MFSKSKIIFRLIILRMYLNYFFYIFFLNSLWWICLLLLLLYYCLFFPSILKEYFNPDLVTSFKVALHAQMAMPDLQGYPWNLTLMWKIPSCFLLDKSSFRRVSPLFLISKICASHFRREPANDKAFKGTVVTRALSTLHVGSLKITLTVPLDYFFIAINI